ncbi:MAG: hypothetical protein M1372_00570 [Patescibacteria group bacterium]|nr:hypothetical protein [Patescibacteria group bacterium]
MPAIAETLRRLIARESAPRTEIPSSSVFRLARAASGSVAEEQLPCGYQSVLSESNGTQVRIFVGGPTWAYVEMDSKSPRHYVSHRWDFLEEKNEGSFTREFNSNGARRTKRNRKNRRKREITEDVYFNDNLTELHFPDGSISFS